MKTLAILGAGGHGKVVADTALSCGWEDIVFFDHAWPNNKLNSCWPIIGNTESFHKYCSNYEAVIVAIGNCKIRFVESNRARDAGASLATIVHAKAILSSFAKVEPGTVILAGAIINIDAHIGFASIVNVGSTVDHDCTLGDAVHVAPGANLSGNVSVGSCTWIGVGSAIRQGITIGSNTTIGAGAVVVSDVPDNITVVGNPAKVLRT